MEFILDFDLQGKNHIVNINLHHEHGATFYRALIDEDHAVDYYRQENGTLKPVLSSIVDNDLVNAIAVRLLEQLHKGGNGFSSIS
jgi:hypothetical protein